MRSQHVLLGAELDSDLGNTQEMRGQPLTTTASHTCTSTVLCGQWSLSLRFWLKLRHRHGHGHWHWHWHWHRHRHRHTTGTGAVSFEIPPDIASARRYRLLSDRIGIFTMK